METEDTLSVLNRILLIATENQKDSPDSNSKELPN